MPDGFRTIAALYMVAVIIADGEIISGRECATMYRDKRIAQCPMCRQDIQQVRANSVCWSHSSPLKKSGMRC